MSNKIIMKPGMPCIS